MPRSADQCELRSVTRCLACRRAEYGVLEGAGLRNLGSRRMASFGESWNCRLGAAGAFVVALAARRSWFCCHQLVAVLLRFGRRRTGWLKKAALGPALSRARLWVLRHGAGRRCVGLLPAGPGRPLGGGQIGLAAYVACSACGRLADAGPGG